MTADGEVWDPETGNGGVSANQISNTSTLPDLALDTNNRPHLVWSQESMENVEIIYIRWDGGKWVTANGEIWETKTESTATALTFSTESERVSKVSVELDSKMFPHVVTAGKFDEILWNNQQIFLYTHWDGSSWVSTTKDGFIPDKPVIEILFLVDRKLYVLDGTRSSIDVAPIILNDRTYLPARYVIEPLGGQVFWDGEERKVTCKLVAPDNAETEDYKENVVELWIGKSTAKINGIEVQIDPNNPEVVPTIINDRTMVPMRFLAESLGCSVEWFSETKKIILTYTP